MTTTEARTAPSRTLARFREEGATAALLIFGDHRRAEAVVLPFEIYVELQGHIDQHRFDAATELQDRIEHAIAHPDTAVKLARRGR